LNWLRGIDLFSDVFGLEFDPFVKTVLLNVDVVIEDGTLGWELNNLPFILPPVGEALSEINTILFRETTTKAPNTGKHENVFKTFNFVRV
jgi:hypothetical protein